MLYFMYMGKWTSVLFVYSDFILSLEYVLVTWLTEMCDVP